MKLDNVHADVDTLSNTLKKLFSQAKSNQMGRKYSPHARFKSPTLWHEVAKKCIELQADPVEFIEAAFMYCSASGGPFPQNLASNAAVRWYHEYLKIVGANEGDDVYAKRIHQQLQHVMSMAVQASKFKNKLIRDTLLDEYMLSLDAAPAFIRVLLMPLDPAIRQKWARKARAEVCDNERLLKTLTKMNCDLTWLTE